MLWCSLLIYLHDNLHHNPKLGWKLADVLQLNRAFLNFHYWIAWFRDASDMAFEGVIHLHIQSEIQPCVNLLSVKYKHRPQLVPPPPAVVCISVPKTTHKHTQGIELISKSKFHIRSRRPTVMTKKIREKNQQRFSLLLSEMNNPLRWFLGIALWSLLHMILVSLTHAQVHACTQRRRLPSS